MSTTSQWVPNYVMSYDEASQAFPHFMRTPLVLRGKPGNEATYTNYKLEKLQHGLVHRESLRVIEDKSLIQQHHCDVTCSNLSLIIGPIVLVPSSDSLPLPTISESGIIGGVCTEHLLASRRGIAKSPHK